jgi:hypothetical protein
MMSGAVAPDIQHELLALAESGAFSARLSEGVSLAFEHYEAAMQRPDYLTELGSAFSQLLGQSLRTVGWSEQRHRFLQSFVRDGLAAGSDENMLVRRLTFLLSLVATELTGQLPPPRQREGAHWLAGLASGLVCDLLFELERCRSTAKPR